MNDVFIYRKDYKTDYQYRKAIGEYRRMGCKVRRVTGGVLCSMGRGSYEIVNRGK